MEARYFRPRKRALSRTSVVLSLVFHSVIVSGLVYFAAREGLLGKELKKIAVEMVREKVPEKPKEPEPKTPEKPKEEPPKVEPPKVVSTPPTPKQVDRPVEKAASSVAMAPPAVAPPAVEIPSFVFEGGKVVESSADPVAIFKNSLELMLFAKWDRPSGVDDAAFVAEVGLAIGRDGALTQIDWRRGSGHARWDESVRKALAEVRHLHRPPPSNFPSQVVIRFDAQAVSDERDL